MLQTAALNLRPLVFEAASSYLNTHCCRRLGWRRRVSALWWILRCCPAGRRWTLTWRCSGPSPSPAPWPPSGWSSPLNLKHRRRQTHKTICDTHLFYASTSCGFSGFVGFYKLSLLKCVFSHNVTFQISGFYSFYRLFTSLFNLAFISCWIEKTRFKILKTKTDKHM